MRPQLELSPDEFEMLIQGLNKLRRKFVSSLNVANGRIEDAKRIQAKIDAGDKYTIEYYSNRQYRFYKPETIAKRKLEVKACDMLIGKLASYLTMYKIRLSNKTWSIPQPTSWSDDGVGTIKDPDICKP